MRRRASTLFLIVFLSFFLFLSLSLHSSRSIIYDSILVHIQHPYANFTTRPATVGYAARKNDVQQERELQLRRNSTANVRIPMTIDSVTILMPDWEVLLIVPSETPLPPGEDFMCLYPNKATSPARFSGVLPTTNQSTFRCILPERNRRRLPFLSPILITRWSGKKPPVPPSPTELMRFSYLAYESFSTETDVVLFVKGVNPRQGFNRLPNEFRCVFFVGNDISNKTVRTAVTSSVQEVFRCGHPDITELVSGAQESSSPVKIKMSLEIIDQEVTVPSLAHYTSWRRIPNMQQKSQLCACTMVYNVAKFLREWVMYHSRIGVDKFILYDNKSDDDVMKEVRELKGEGYDIETLYWMWPKTQEAGFSHAALYAKDSCQWMMYIDVDEFVFATQWVNSSQPSNTMLKELLPSPIHHDHDHDLDRDVSDNDHPLHHDDGHQHGRRPVGQVSIMCNEFGPSNRRSHPAEGVTQGYDCRRKVENRHKSIVLLDAIDYSLQNAVHHFKLDERYYRGRQLRLEVAVVNHYKYQVWSEFKAKFRRRVSAYVVDWKQSMNLLSKDRTPGLGFEAVEPPGWEHKFCEMNDDRLKLITRRWFGIQTETGYKMAWQR